jgi:hypothetical protein
MGFFFRRSTRVGPFRLNFSKSGIGASVGVKGARLTMTPRGTTYVTVGSHGFYYRETLSQGNHIREGHRPAPVPEQQQVSSTENTIASAGSLDLVDSSSERLIQQLNERANMFNPAWILYVAAMMCLAGLAMLPPVQILPNLPEVTLTSDRSPSNIDQYSALTARYGEPNSILFTEADLLSRVPVGTANYSDVHVKVMFVPNGCLNAYGLVKRALADGSRYPALGKREMKSVTQCLPAPNSGWATVSYIDSTDNSAISAAVATGRLDMIRLRKTEFPIVELASTPGNKPQHTSGKLTTRKQPQTRPEMRSNDESRLAAAQMKRAIKDGETRMLYSRTALVTLALGLLIAGAIAHKKNMEKRESRLFYELDEVEQQKNNAVKQSLELLAKCHRIWRIEAKSATWDWKRNAGASFLVRRTTIGVSNLSPPRVKTNIPVPCVNMGRTQLYFLPDTILYRDDMGYGAIAYIDFRLVQGLTRFIESEGVPSDAIIVDHTWRYVNKNGGPDRRFNNNRQLPVLQLGVLVFTSSKGLNIQLNTSNPQQSLAFANCWGTQFQRARESYEQRGHSHPPSEPAEASSSQTRMLRKILGVGDNASDAEISAAYRRLAQMYQPDKVADLAPEFQALADKRMKEVNAAYEVLKQKA